MDVRAPFLSLLLSVRSGTRITRHYVSDKASACASVVFKEKHGCAFYLSCHHPTEQKVGMEGWGPGQSWQLTGHVLAPLYFSASCLTPPLCLVQDLGFLHLATARLSWEEVLGIRQVKTD